MRIKKKTAVISLVLLSLTASILIVCAYMYKKTQVVENELIPAQVSCEIEEEFSNNVKNSVKVRNTSNIPVYIRVIVMVYWQDSKGNILTDSKLAELPQIYVTDDWISDEDNIYYYKSKVEPGELTNEFLKQPIQLRYDYSEKDTQTQVLYEKQQVVEIIAEAIQSEPEEAVTDSWKVTISNGNIVSVP